MIIKTSKGRAKALKNFASTVEPTNTLFTYSVKIRTGNVLYLGTLTKKQLTKLGDQINSQLGELRKK